MAKVIYDWQRFWCPRDSSYSLQDGGYLADPHSTWGAAFNPNLLAFEDVAQAPCLVLLGEPGIGKTQAIEASWRTVEAELRAAGHETLLVDLRTGDSEDRLIRKIFGHPTFKAWQEGSHDLFLFLDSLDECLLRVSTVAGLLLEELAGRPVDRLRLRIACRTAEWPQLLEIGLNEKWGEEAVWVVELVPLRRADVTVAAQTRGVDPEAFLESIQEAGAVPLAIRPVTLEFLLNTYLQTGSLPSTQTELYRRGCRLLCEELSESRRATKAKGKLAPDQRMIIAGRIAALTLLSGRYVVNSEADRGVAVPGTLSVSEISGGTETAHTGPFVITDDAVQEALGTGLFSSRGAGLLGWSHQTYAEYLAAWYLCQKQIPPKQILTLVRHSGDADGHLVPQLEEMASWIAGMLPEVFREVMNTDPAVLLQSDVATADAQEREKLVAKLLEQSAVGSLPSLIFKYRSRFRKLDHPRLADQLRPVIADHGRSSDERFLAIDIAEACRRSELQTELADAALDQQDTLLVRVQAAGAVLHVGDLATKARLRPLASAQDDPEDELKGCGLRAIWPDVITAPELFPLLSRPKNNHFHGTYSGFLEDGLTAHLQVSDLPTALYWAAQQQADQMQMAPQDRLAWQIVQRGWQEIDSPSVLEPFAAAVLNRLRQHLPLPGDAADAAPVPQDHGKRRRLVEAMVAHTDSADDMELMAFSSPPLVVVADIPWLIRKAEQAEAPGLQRLYAQLIDRMFFYEDAENLEAVLLASQRGGVLGEVLAPRFEAIPLDSPRTRQLREYVRDEGRWRSRRANPPLLTPPPAERVAQDLDRFEEGELAAWRQLNLDITLKPDSTHYGSDLAFDLTQEPGWQAADDMTKSRMLASAVTYLREQDPEVDKWLGKNVIHRSAWAGYRALHLLLSERPNAFATLPLEVWTRWIPVVVSFPVATMGNEYEMHRRMIQNAFRADSASAIATLFTVIDQEIAKGETVFALGLAEYCWTPGLASAVLDKLKAAGMRPGDLAVLLGELLSREDAVLLPIQNEAHDFAASLVSTYVTDRASDEARANALAAAHEMMLYAGDAGWPEVWPAVQSDAEFGRALLEEVAYRDQRRGRIAQRLTEDQVADLYLWLAAQYPHAEDPVHIGAYTVGPREAIGDWRDSLLSSLENKGTEAAVSALHKVATARPDISWLRSVVLRAQEMTRRNTWTPLLPNQVLQLAGDSSLRHVQSGHQLLQVVIESLARLQAKLTGETPMAQFLWSNMPGGKTYRPKDEEAFSDFVKDHLVSDLKERGIVVNREVQIRRGRGAIRGQDTDIHVDALSLSSGVERYDVISLIIEAKGCWHSELKTAMKTQLVERYLKENPCRHGLYLVGWFHSDAWDQSDTRKAKVPKITFEEVGNQLASQAMQLSAGALEVVAVVLDVPL